MIALQERRGDDMTNLSQDKNQMLQACIGFHGHFCPGLAIGFKAAGELMRILQVERDGDEELFAIVETDACGADAIQVITGCTFGKGNFFSEIMVSMHLPLEAGSKIRLLEAACNPPVRYSTQIS